MDTALRDDMIREIERLPPERQAAALDLIRGLQPASVRGVPGRNLMASFGSISEEDALEMERVIDEKCERVDLNGW